MNWLYIIECATKRLSEFGTFLVGLASIIAAFSWRKKIQQKFLEKKIESAFLILNELKFFIDDFNTIGSKKDKLKKFKLILVNLETLKKKYINQLFKFQEKNPNKYLI